MTKEALTLALEALKQIDAAMPFPVAKLAIKKAEEALAQPEQKKERCVGCEACIDTACGRDECPKGWPKAAQPEQEPVAWRNAAIRVGKDLCSVGPFGYYDMTAEQWLDWALSVVTVHTPPQRTWVGLTDDEFEDIEMSFTPTNKIGAMMAVEAKLKEKNNG